MNYNILHKWVEQQSLPKLIFKEFFKFENQYFVCFKQTKLMLQFSLSGKNSFCFFTKNRSVLQNASPNYRVLSSNLAKAKLISINIKNDDRVISLKFNKTNIFAEEEYFYLHLELIPRYESWVLTKLQNNNEVVVDCLKKVSFADNPARQILPGFAYSYPPAGYEFDFSTLKTALCIDNNFNVKPCENGYTEINSLFEDLYYKHMFVKQTSNLKNRLLAKINKEVEKKKKKKQKQLKELENTKNEEIFKQKAELFKANIAFVKPGQKSLKVIDYYNEPYDEIEIEVNAELSPNQNMEKWFKKYRKARDGRLKIAKMLIKTEEEIEAIERQIYDIEEAEDYFELKNLLPKSGKHKKTNEKQNRKKLAIDENWEILIGRTSKENDELSLKVAKKNDWWFHTRVFQGTHVILRNFKNKTMPEWLCILCCQLAAYYSKAKKSSNVPVDYTQIKYVRKPKKSPPGYVIYTDQKTYYCDPLSMRDAALIIERKVK